LNIESRDSLLDSLLTGAASVHIPGTGFLLAGDTTPNDEVTLANIPFYFDLHVSFIGPVTDEEIDIGSAS
jgi:hypothetical protein